MPPAVESGRTPALFDTLPPGLAEKRQRLFNLLSSFESVIVAFSGGADSAFLAWAATEALGPAALCVTADSPSYPDRHRELARRLAAEFGLRHEVIFTRELERPEYRSNGPDRCYHCKHELYGALQRMAVERGIAVIVDGNNADDRGDYRPGRRAARELGVRSPLDQVGLTKAEIRQISRCVPLPTWDEPASACLSSRIPYYSEVTSDKLRMIERAEEVLRGQGFRVCRVRHHEVASGRARAVGSGTDSSQPVQALARLEVGADELPRVFQPDVRDAIVGELRRIGYEHVTVDLRGYRMGSLNEGVTLRSV